MNKLLGTIWSTATDCQRLRLIRIWLAAGKRVLVAVACLSAACTSQCAYKHPSTMQVAEGTGKHLPQRFLQKVELRLCSSCSVATQRVAQSRRPPQRGDGDDTMASVSALAWCYCACCVARLTDSWLHSFRSAYASAASQCFLHEQRGGSVMAKDIGHKVSAYSAL